MTPEEMLAVLDDAIAATPRARAIALELTAPEVLGQRGRRLRTGGGYGYTRRQCTEIRSVILAAAREDLDAARRQVGADGG